MGLRITRKNCRVRPESQVLEIHLEGEADEISSSGRARLMVVFSEGGKDRRFPLSGRYEQSVDGNGTWLFRADAVIELEYIFFEYQPAGEVAIEFQYCDLQEGWICLEKGEALPPELFVHQVPRRGGVAKMGSIFCYLLCTLLLPVWLADGVLAVRGIRPLHPAARRWKGKKAVIYHAHGLVHGWTGYGYSLREIKTGYWKWQYERYCRRISDTEGVLFLSERAVDRGGNLDRVRDSLRGDSSLQIREFLVAKPVHKLSFGELKRAARLLAGARVVVLEDFYPQLHALSIRPETRVLQLWHACGVFKLFGLSELGVTPLLEQSTANHRNYSAVVCSGKKLVPFYSEAYGISASSVRPAGVPRTDIFFESGYRKRTRERLFEQYPALRGRRVVLFAPTFRGSGNKTAYYPMERFPIEDLIEKLPEDVIFLIKNHPFVKDRMNVAPKYSDRILDLSDGENINDLLFVTAALVTDYSSVIFEAALLRIPMLFYAFDLEDYLRERDLYFDFAAFAPGEIVQQKADLAGGISRMLENGETERYDAFCEFFLDSLDGKSTERATQLVYELLCRSGAGDGRGDEGKTEQGGSEN